MARVAEYSGGIPKSINALCRLALLAAGPDASKRVTAQVVERVVHEVSVADGEAISAKALSTWRQAPPEQGEALLADADGEPPEEAVPAHRPEGGGRPSSPGSGSAAIALGEAWRRGDDEEPNARATARAEPEVAAYRAPPRPAKGRRLRRAVYTAMGAGLFAVSLWGLWPEGDDLSPSVTDSPGHGITAREESTENQAAAAYEVESKAVPEEVAGLLATAEEHLKADRLIAPRFNNALSVYQKVLRLDQDNAQAKDGINRIKATLLAYASDAEVQGELEAARNQIMKVLAIDRNDEAATAALATLGP